MATITKLKGEVLNKNLPILLQDGSITNYYYGNFRNKLTEFGYTISQDEATAVEAFVQSGIKNGWIDYVQYLLPFIGDSTTPEAGVVPLIDNVDNYRMAEYDSSRDYSDLFTFDQVTGKIKCVHTTSNAEPITTPVTFATQKKGLSNIVRAGNLSYVENSHNIILDSENQLEYESETVYVRQRFISLSDTLRLQYVRNSGAIINPSLFRNNFETIIQYGYDANFAFFSKINENDIFMAGQFLEYSGFKQFNAMVHPSTLLGWPDLNYGKYKVGAPFDTYDLKLFAFIDPDIPQNMMEGLSTAITTLTTALGR